MLQAIVIYPEANADHQYSHSIILTSLDGNMIIILTRRGYLYIQTLLPLLLPNQRCFQSNLTTMNSRIQYVHRLELSEKDLCLKRRVKCRNGGQCIVDSNGEIICQCPNNTMGPNCEYGKNRFRCYFFI